MGKFAIVEWESNKTSDYICKELLKVKLLVINKRNLYRSGRLNDRC